MRSTQVTATAGATRPTPREARRGRMARVAVLDRDAERGFMPGLGVAGAVLGTIFALATIPPNPTRRDSLILSATSMALCMLAAPAAAAMLSLRNMLRTENILALCPIFWVLLDLVRGLYAMPGLSQSDVATTFISIGVYSATTWMGTMTRPWRMPKRLIEVGSWVPADKTLMSIATAMFFLAMLRFALPCGFNIVLMVKGLTGNRWSAPWNFAGETNRTGGWGSFIEHLVYFGYLLPTIAAMMIRRHGLHKPVVWIVLLMSATFIAFMAQSGGRRIIGVCIGSGVLYYVMDKERLRVMHLAIMAACLFGLLWFLSMMLLIRNQGFDNIWKVAEYTTEVVSGKAGEDVHGMTVDDNFYRLAQIVNVMPTIHPYLNFDYALYILCRPIPRALWKNKPSDGGFEINWLVGEGASLSSSVIGEFYMSYGLMAVALGGYLMGKLSRLSDPFFSGKRGGFGLLLYGYMTMWMVGGFRSLQDLMLFSYPMLVLSLMSRFFKGKPSSATLAPR